MISPLAAVQTGGIHESVTIHEYSVIRRNVVLERDVVIHPFVVIEEGIYLGPGIEVFPGSHIGKTPKGAGATARPINYKPVVFIGDDCVIGPNAVIYYDVVIGRNTLVGDGASIREGCRIGSRCVIGRHVTLNYATTVGDDTKIMDHSWMAGKMSIGSGVFISGGVLTSNDNEMSFDGYQDERISGPCIEDRVKIGAGAVLLPSLRVGEDSMVAAGAVVTKDVAPHELVAGVPARFVRRVVHSGNFKRARC